MASTPDRVLFLRLDPDTHRALADRAYAERTSSSALARLAIQQYLAAKAPSTALYDVFTAAEDAAKH